MWRKHREAEHFECDPAIETDFTIRTRLQKGERKRVKRFEVNRLAKPEEIEIERRLQETALQKESQFLEEQLSSQKRFL